MVISLQELRKQAEQEERRQAGQKSGRLSWEQEDEEAPQGALKLARFLYAN